MYNREYVKSILPKDKKILEFGPLNGPIADKATFPNTKYADIKSTEDIKKLYSGNEYLKATGIQINIDDIVDVDYVVTNNYKEDINEKFDVVILSHVIEHMKDIIFFFQDVKNVLKKDGLLIINYPDKRYCFDHYRVESSFRDAYATYTNGESENDKMIFDFYLNVLHENNPSFFWNEKDIISKINSSLSETILKELDGNKHSKFEDVHYWPFSDYGFLKFLYDARRFNLLDFELVEFRPTQKDTQEFLVILKYSDNKNDSLLNLINETDQNYIDIINREKIGALLENNDTIKKELEEKNAELEGIKNQLSELQVNYNFANENIEKISSELLETSNKLSAMNESLNNLQDKYDNAKLDISNLKKECESLNDIIDDKNQDLIIKDEQNAMNMNEKNMRIRNLESELSNIYNSRSWKYTKFLRK